MYVTKRLVANNVSFLIVRNFARRIRRVTDPGIENRKTLVNNDNEFVELNDYDFDLETDFMNIGTSHKQHLQELDNTRARQRILIVKQKYFKEHTPNFLTWNDKEQIHYLHNKDPEEWSIEKLSEGFPALPHVITKIVKPRLWEKKSNTKIQNHDKSVEENWRLFKENKLTNLNSDLVEHLNKFTNRALNLQHFRPPKEMERKRHVNNVKAGTEFSEIISSYERLRGKCNNFSKENISIKSSGQKSTKDDSYVLGDSTSNKYSKHITLQHLQNQILKKSVDGTVLPDEQVLLQEMKNEVDKESELQYVKPTYQISKTEDTKQVAIVKRRPTHNYLLEYPEKIVIPKHKLKQGCTYKLNDCYYDDDGLFLYRVPGMYK